MSKREWLVSGVAAVVLLALLVVASAEAADGSFPKWVSNAPSAGAVLCYNPYVQGRGPVPGFATSPYRTNADSLKTGLRLIEVTAATDTRVTFWYRNGADWVKVAPEFWFGAAGDSTVFIAAGVTKAFTFPRPPIGQIWLTSGTAYFSGE